MTINAWKTINSWSVVTPTVPQGVVTIGDITKTETTASIPFTYNDTDQTGFEYRLDGGAAISATSSIDLTGLVAETTYSIEVRAVNETGNGAWSSVGNFTTDAVVVVPKVPQGVVTIGAITKSETTASIPFTYNDTDQTGFEYRLDGGAAISATSSIDLTGLVAETTYSIEVRAVNETGNGAWSSVGNFTTDAVVVVPTVPKGVVTIGAITKSETTASIPFTYNDTDQTGFEYRLDGGAAISVTSSIDLTGLVAETAYSIEVRAVNETGNGTWSSVSNFTTDAINNVNEEYIHQFRVDGEVVKPIVNGDDFYQSRDQIFFTAITTGEPVSEFIKAKYELFTEFSSKPFLIKTLNGGITIDVDEFKTTINKDDLPTAGRFYHQFTVTNKQNKELPPIFSGYIKIKEVR